MTNLYQRIVGPDLGRFEALHWISPADCTVQHRRVFTVTNWIDIKSFSHNRHKNEEFIALFVGRQTYSKGFDRFLKASELINNQEIHFLSTGVPRGKVQGCGFVPFEQMWSLYSKAAVSICSARDDSFGLVIVESLATGTPVIASSLLSHKALGLPLLYADSPEEIALQVKKVFHLWKFRKDDYERICQEARESARRYDSSVILPKFEEMLVSVRNGQD